MSASGLLGRVRCATIQRTIDQTDVFTPTILSANLRDDALRRRDGRIATGAGAWSRRAGLRRVARPDDRAQRDPYWTNGPQRYGCADTVVATDIRASRSAADGAAPRFRARWNSSISLAVARSSTGHRLATTPSEPASVNARVMPSTPSPPRMSPRALSHAESTTSRGADRCEAISRASRIVAAPPDPAAQKKAQLKQFIKSASELFQKHRFREALGKARDRSPHYLMKSAIKRFLEVEEALEAERCG